MDTLCKLLDLSGHTVQAHKCPTLAGWLFSSVLWSTEPHRDARALGAQAAEAEGETVTLRRLLDEVRAAAEPSRGASEQGDAPAGEPAVPQQERSGAAAPEQADGAAAAAAEEAPMPALRDSPHGTSQRSWAAQRLKQQVRGLGFCDL